MHTIMLFRGATESHREFKLKPVHFRTQLFWILSSFKIVIIFNNTLAEIKRTTKLQTKVVLMVLYQILLIENDRVEDILIEVLTYFMQSSCDQGVYRGL